MRPLQVAGIPLGIFRGTRYDEVRLVLNQGDLLVMVSDGVLDSEDAGERPYDPARLAELVEESRALPAPEILARILADLERHSAGARLTDDQTLVVLKVR